MASLIFGLMRPKKADEPRSEVPLGSSGEQDDYDSESSEDESKLSDNSSSNIS
jgi:hypothetical protein